MLYADLRDAGDPGRPGWLVAAFALNETEAGSAEIIPLPVRGRPAADETPEWERSHRLDGPAVRIYKPSMNPMQSGRAKSRHWIVEFEAQSAPFIEPLMGWTGSSDPLRGLTLEFPTKESAIRFAEEQGYSYSVREPRDRMPILKSYAEKFQAVRRIV